MHPMRWIVLGFVLAVIAWLIPCAAFARDEVSHRSVIEDFDDGTVVLGSFPGEDVDPDDWLLDSKNTFDGSAFALRLYGNTWKTEEIAPVRIDSGSVWEVAAYTSGTVAIHGFGIADSAHVLFYAFAGTLLLDTSTWVTVYQGAFPSSQWNLFRLPVADDWLAYFGYLPEVRTLVFVCDKDGGEPGSVSFDHIVDITADLPIAPAVEISSTAGKAYRDSRGTKRLDVQFTASVHDPDSQTHGFHWDFGDGATSTEQNPTHTFLVQDDHAYTVLLSVCDDTDRWGWASCTVSVDPGPSSLPFSVNFVGDIMLARGYEQSGGIIPTQGVEAIFAPTLSILGQAADVTVANMESPLTTATEHHPTKPIYFKASPANVAGLVYAGIDVVTLANNHIYDYLDAGLQETQEVIEGAGILHSGAGMDSYEAYLPVYRTESGISIAFLASSDRTGQYGNYQPYLNAGFNKPGFAYMTAYDVARHVATVRSHADLVVVETHSGDEYGQVPREGLDPSELADPYGDEDFVGSSVRPTSRNRAIRQAAIDAGADVVVSHHPHVIQGLEVYRGKLIAHSLGNFTFDLRYPETFPTMVLNATADAGGFSDFRIVPAYIDDWIPRPATGGLGLRILDHLARRSKELDTYVYVDREQTLGTVRLDTLGMPQEVRAFRLSAPLAWVDGEWKTAPLRLARRGNVSSIDSLNPPGPWEYRLGRDILWCGSCEDEGSTLWNLNSPSEWYDSTESYSGARSITHRRNPGSAGVVVTNLEWRLKRIEDCATTLQGFVKTLNGAACAIEILYYDSRYGSSPLSSESTAAVSGDTAWTHVWKELAVPQGALYYDVRVRSDRPQAGEACSWFDDIALIEWTTWQSTASASIAAPNDWYFIQFRSPEPSPSAVVHYTETAFGPLSWPEATIEPLGLAVAVMPQESAQATVAIGNEGTGSLHYALDVDATWASVAPRSGTVSPGEAALVTVTFAAASMDTGSYQGSLTVRMDDPERPEAEVLLHMWVQPLAVRDLVIHAADGNVQLEWSPLAAEAYRVYRSSRTTGPWEMIATTTSPAFCDSGACELFPQAYYRVTVLVPNGAMPQGDATSSVPWMILPSRE